MPRYRKIEVSTWGDLKFRSLSKPMPNARDCWLHLLSNRATTNIPGLFHAYAESLARDLEWSLDDYLRVFKECIDKGMSVKADWEAGLVFMPNAVKHNPPENPNVVKSWLKKFKELPECELKEEAFNHIKQEIKPLGERYAKEFIKPFRERYAKGFVEPLDQPFPKALIDPIKIPLANQEQEQEQEQEKERISDLEQDRSISAPSPPPLQKSKVAQTEDMESESPSSQTPLETDIPLPLPVSVLGEGVKSSHGPSTHLGNSNDPPTPLAVSGVGSPMDCSGHLPNKRPVSEEHFEVWELIALFADRWKRQQSEALPKHDNLQRVLQALRDFDFTSCQAAIYGHHKLATKEGSQLGRYFRHIFPAAKINGKSHTNKLDEDRFREFVEAGKKLIPNKNAELKRKQIKQKMDQEAERETQHIADLVGVRSGDSFQTMVKKFKGAKS